MRMNVPKIGRAGLAAVISVLVVAGTGAGVAAAAVAGPGGVAGGAGRLTDVSGGAARPETAVPAGFKAAAITWLPPGRGWVLGSSKCGTRSCADVVVTSNGGTSWHQLGRLPVPVANVDTPAGTGVAGLRFATAQTGWAFGPALFRTTNGGRSWAARRLPGGGKQVLALTVGSASTYAVVSSCKEFAAHCTGQPLSLWRTGSATGTSWTRVPVSLPLSSQASVASFGQTMYAVIPGIPGTLFAATDGRHFSARPSPCSAAEQTGLIQVVPTSATKVALLCDGNPAISTAIKHVYRSADTGRTDHSAGITGPMGIDAELAASSSGNLLVAAWANGSWMYLNDTGKTAWSAPLSLGDGGAGFADVAFVTGQVAWAVYGPVSDFPADFGRLYVTRDGGKRWKLRTL